MERSQTEQRAPTPGPPQVRSGARAGSVRRRIATRACARSLASSASGFVIGTTDDSPGEEVRGDGHRGNGERANDGLCYVDHRELLYQMSDSDIRASVRRGPEAMKKISRTSSNTALQNLLQQPTSTRFPQLLGISGLDRSQPHEQQCEGVVHLKEGIREISCRGIAALAARHQFLDRCSAQSVCCGQRGFSS